MKLLGPPLLFQEKTWEDPLVSLAGVGREILVKFTQSLIPHGGREFLSLQPPPDILSRPRKKQTSKHSQLGDRNLLGIAVKGRSGRWGWGQLYYWRINLRHRPTKRLTFNCKIIGYLPSTPRPPMAPGPQYSNRASQLKELQISDSI